MATPFLSNSRIPMDLLLPVVKSFWALKGGYSSTTCQAFEIGVESNFANGGRSAYETYRSKYSSLYTGLGISSMKSLRKGRRASLWARGPSMRTWISVLCRWIPTFGKAHG